MKDKTIGFAICGSFCTIEQSLSVLKELAKSDANIIPIMSEIVYTTDTRFTKAESLIKTVEEITKNKVIKTVEQAEPIGPKGLLDLLIICPCTGNTISKIANGITDTSVTMAAKAHLRNNRPVLISLATNDALSGSAQSIGRLLSMKNVYFTPFGQDDALKKPTSMICDFGSVIKAGELALEGKQMQPILLK